MEKQMPTKITQTNGKKKWRAAVMVNGQKKSKAFDPTREGKRKAIEWENMMRDLLQKQLEIPTVLPKITVLEWANEYLSESKRRNCRATYNEKKLTFKLFIATVGKEALVEDITVSCALKHLAAQNDSRSGNAANKDRKNLAAAWNFGIKYIEGFPEKRNPFRAVDKFGEDRNPRYVPPVEDVKKVLAVCDGQDQLMLYAFIMTGARRSELWRVTWDDVDFESSTIRLWTRKRKGGGKQYDSIPMVPELHKRLLEWKEQQPVKTDYVFVNVLKRSYRYGEPFKQRDGFLKRKCAEAGVRCFGYHGLRHFMAKKMYLDGKALKSIKGMLRHQKSTTTELYLQTIGLEDIRDDVENSLGSFVI